MKNSNTYGLAGTLLNQVLAQGRHKSVVTWQTEEVGEAVRQRALLGFAARISSGLIVPSFQATDAATGPN